MKKILFAAMVIWGGLFAISASAAPLKSDVPVPDKLRERVVGRYDAWKAMDLKALYLFFTETRRKSMSYESFIINHRPKVELNDYEVLDVRCDTEESCGVEVRLALKRLPVKGGGTGAVEIVRPERWIAENGEWYVYSK